MAASEPPPRQEPPPRREPGPPEPTDPPLGLSPDETQELALPDEEATLGGDIDDMTLGEVDAVTEENAGTLFLKQNGQVYVVSDWDMLREWVHEQRVDEQDLVSEGGIRWEPVAGRPELADLFPSDATPTEPGSGATPSPYSPLGSSASPGGSPGHRDRPTDAELGVTEADVPFPFGRVSTAYTSGAPALARWTDEDAQGVPTGLPRLPNEHSDPREFTLAPSLSVTPSFESRTTPRRGSPTPVPAEGVVRGRDRGSDRADGAW